MAEEEEEVGGQRSEALLTGNRKMFTFGRIVKWLLPLRGNRSHFSALKKLTGAPCLWSGGAATTRRRRRWGEEEVKDVEEEEGWGRKRMRMGRWRRISWRRRGEVEEGEGQGPGDSRRYRRGVKGPNVQRRGRAPPTHARLRPLFLFFFLSLRGELFFT